MTLSEEQQHALDELMALVPGRNGNAQPAGEAAQANNQGDWLQTWLGISSAQVKRGMLDILAKKNGVEKSLIDWVETNPLDATFEFIALASWAFYQAEKDENPRIKSYVDSLYYISTCASVGYADIFAVTQPGRAIATLVMTVGPALTNRTLDRPKIVK